MKIRTCERVKDQGPCGKPVSRELIVTVDDAAAPSSSHYYCAPCGAYAKRALETAAAVTGRAEVVHARLRVLA